MFVTYFAFRTICEKRRNTWAVAANISRSAVAFPIMMYRIFILYGVRVLLVIMVAVVLGRLPFVPAPFLLSGLFIVTRAEGRRLG
jgi:hypothetical protein